MRAILLFPFTVIYYYVNIFWDLFWKTRKPARVNSKVISIGNITVGGSGKTTVVGYIAQRLLAHGKKTAVVARGYGRPEKAPIVVHEKDIDWHKCGDESAILARNIDGLTIYVNSDKTIAAMRAAVDGFEFIIIDDGFQHRDLYRDIDIVCLDGRRPFGNGLLLPSGSLRETRRALKRADIVLVVDLPDGADLPKLRTKAQIFKASKKIIAVRSRDEAQANLSGMKIVAFCGLGNPQSFRESLNTCGCEIAGFMEYRDHHIYDNNDVLQISKRLCQEQASAAVTTFKDFVKVENLWPDDFPLYYLEIAIELDNPDNFLKLLIS